MLRVQDIQKSFSATQERALFQDVSFSLGPSEWISIIGPSGAGKTTLLNCIAGIYDINGGSIELDGQAIHSLKDYKNRTHKNLMHSPFFI